MEIDFFGPSFKVNLQTLEIRRNFLYLQFAKNCLKNGKSTDLFPKNENLHIMDTRYHEEFAVLHANTERMKKSSVITMQHLLNADLKENSN